MKRGHCVLQSGWFCCDKMKTLIDKSDPYLLGPNKQEINFEAQPLFGELESEKKCFVPTKKRREGTQGPASPLPL